MTRPTARRSFALAALLSIAADCGTGPPPPPPVPPEDLSGTWSGALTSKFPDPDTGLIVTIPVQAVLMHTERAHTSASTITGTLTGTAAAGLAMSFAITGTFTPPNSVALTAEPEGQEEQGAVAFAGVYLSGETVDTISGTLTIAGLPAATLTLSR